MRCHCSEKFVTCTVVGDGMVGKTEICKTITGRPESEEYKATVQDEFTVETHMMGDKYTLRLVDTSGQHDYKEIRVKSYKETDVFIVCYSLADRESFQSIETFWIPEIRKICKKTPIILVATGKDIMDENNNVSINEGQKTKDETGADVHVTCAAKNKDEVKDIFEDAVMSVIKHRKRRRSSLLSHIIAR